MTPLETISSAVASITSNKMRALLTMFGIVVGIASVMLITSVGDGFRNTMTGFFEDLGLDEIQFFNTAQARPIEWQDRLTLGDADFLRQHPEIMFATTQLNLTAPRAVSVLDGDDRAVIIGGRDHYAVHFGSNVRGGNLIEGRYLSAQDVATQAPVAIINETTALAIFGTTQGIIGRDLEVRTPQGLQRFSIIGLFESADATMLDDLFEMPFNIVVPISIVQRLQDWNDRVNSVVVRVNNTDMIHETGDTLVAFLERRNDSHDMLNSWSMASALDETNAVIGVFTVFLTLVASISLLVGGIGVMNIMLVSVTERTREIGIRKSLGATSGNIVVQFLVEAAVLTLIGGMLGVVLGYVGGIGVGHLVTLFLDMELVPVVSLPTVAMVVLISGFIGIAFGVYPARKASKLDPVESLRFE